MACHCKQYACAAGRCSLHILLFVLSGAQSLVVFKIKVLVQQVPHQANALAHGERRGNGANAQPFQVAQEEEGHARRNSQAGYIKADFNARVRHLGNVRQLPTEQCFSALFLFHQKQSPLYFL